MCHIPTNGIGFLRWMLVHTRTTATYRTSQLVRTVLCGNYITNIYMLGKLFKLYVITADTLSIWVLNHEIGMEH
jgi:hypothetical protein